MPHLSSAQATPQSPLPSLQHLRAENGPPLPVCVCSHHLNNVDNNSRHLGERHRWVGNCVGYANHKYFVQFVSYAAVGTLFVGFSLVAPMLGKAQDVGFVHKSAPFG